MKIDIPYNKSFMSFNIDKNKIAGILEPQEHTLSKEETQESIVKKALANPIGSTKLSDMAISKQRMLIITSDHTRPVPSKITLPLLLEEARRKNPDIEIKILIATGFHRPSTYDEMVNKYGINIVEQESLIVHSADNKDDLVCKGMLPSGTELWVNKLTDWADIIVAEGFIEPHFFAGFSGGRKSILPGISSKKTIFENHCSEFISNSKSRTGILTDNPIHTDMVYAAEKVGLAFILNVVIDKDKKIINAFSGHFKEAHAEGCDFVKKLLCVDKKEADIVITSNGGYPLDQNIYQSVKGMTAAEACVNKNGVIIMVSSCIDGHGGEGFYNWFKNAKTPKEVADKISSISRDMTIADQWEAQILARVLIKAKVIMVTDSKNEKLVMKMHMQYADSIENAIEKAYEILGKEAKALIIRDGVGIIIREEEE